MLEHRAYLVLRTELSARRMFNSERRRRAHRGRHRAGAPGLRPCGEFCPSLPYEPRRWRARRPLVPLTIRWNTPSTRRAAVLVLIGTLMISGWFALLGASAFADMVHP